MLCIVSSANATDAGEPIGNPLVCLNSLLFHWKTFASMHKRVILIMSSTYEGGCWLSVKASLTLFSACCCGIVSCMLLHQPYLLLRFTFLKTHLIKNALPLQQLGDLCGFWVPIEWTHSTPIYLLNWKPFVQLGSYKNEHSELLSNGSLVYTPLLYVRPGILSRVRVLIGSRN